MWSPENLGWEIIKCLIQNQYMYIKFSSWTNTSESLPQKYIYINLIIQPHNRPTSYSYMTNKILKIRFLFLLWRTKRNKGKHRTELSCLQSKHTWRNKTEISLNSCTTLQILFDFRCVLAIKSFQLLVKVHVAFINVVNISIIIVHAASAVLLSLGHLFF